MVALVSAVVLLPVVVMVSANAVEVLVKLFASPPYTAVKLCVPVEANVVSKLARPAVTAAEPMVAAPSLKVTTPVGVLPVTVAVSVTT